MSQAWTEKREIALTELPNLGDKWHFVGIDLAPQETLETGVAVIDRNRQLVRMDKLYTDENILLFLDNLGPRQNVIIALDVPKNLNIPSKWRQEQIKMHPVRMIRRSEEDRIGRCAQRVYDLYDQLRERGFLTVMYFNNLARLRYGLYVPFRVRTPQGCRALQAAVKTQLRVNNLPNNLAPSSVLDAMIGAYAAWSLYRGKEGRHYQLFACPDDRLELEPLKRLEA
jgi:hypothetical protein